MQSPSLIPPPVRGSPCATVPAHCHGLVGRCISLPHFQAWPRHWMEAHCHTQHLRRRFRSSAWAGPGVDSCNASILGAETGRSLVPAQFVQISELARAEDRSMAQKLWVQSGYHTQTHADTGTHTHKAGHVHCSSLLPPPGELHASLSLCVLEGAGQRHSSR